MRKSLHLIAGSNVQLQQRSGGIFLKKVRKPRTLVMRNGLWVYVGRVPKNFSAQDALERLREERMKQILDCLDKP